MAGELASMYVTISADVDGFKKGLDDVKASMTGMQQGWSQLQGFVATGAAAFGAAMVASATAIATTGVQFDAMKEQAQVAFTTMLGSGQQAQDMLNQLQQFAAKTPFEFPDLISASQRLMAMGIQAQDVIPTLTAVGDAVAAMGGSSAMVDRVTTAIGQMNAKGKASGEEMRQLTEAGIPVWDILAKKIGVDIPTAMDMVSKGAVTSSVAIGAITEGIETRFGGMMDKQSQTWNGIISNIKDGFTQLSGAIMQPFFDFAKEKLAVVATALGNLVTAFQTGSLNADTFKNAVSGIVPPALVDGAIALWNGLKTIGETIVSIISPITDIISQFVSWQDVFTGLGIVLGAALIPALVAAGAAIGGVIAAAAPVVAIFAGIVAAVALLRNAWEHDFLGIQEITQNLMNTATTAFDKIKSNFGELWTAMQPLVQKGIELFNKLKEAWEGNSGNITRTLQQLGRMIGDVFTVIGAALSLAVNTMINVMTIWIDLAQGDWAGAWKQVKQIGSDVMGFLKTVITSTFDIILAAFGTNVDDVQEWLDNVVNAIKDTAKSWYDYGANIVQGLLDGVQDKWRQFTSWTSSTFKGWVDWFDRLFHFGSPSKLMIQRGKWLGEGLQIGISDSARGVLNSMSDLGQGINTGLNRGYAAATLPAPQPSGAATAADAAMMRENNDLLRALLAELRGKNMSPTVSINGGMTITDRVRLSAGLRA